MALSDCGYTQLFSSGSLFRVLEWEGNIRRKEELSDPGSMEPCAVGEMQLRLCVVGARCRELDAGVSRGNELHKVWIVDIMHSIVQTKF